MEVSRQEYWSALLFPSPGDLPDPGIKAMSLASPALACGFFTTSAIWDAPSPIASWQIDGGKSGNSGTFYFPGLLNHYGWWLQPWNEKMLAPWKKSYDKPRQHIRKQRLCQQRSIKSKLCFFSVVIYGYESWTIKKAEHWKIDAFELWCWRTLLRGPWTARRSSQSILKEISPGCSLEGLMLKLKLQYFGLLWPPDAKNWLIRKDPDARKD